MKRDAKEEFLCRKWAFVEYLNEYFQEKTATHVGQFIEFGE